MDYRWKAAAILVPITFAFYAATQILTSLVNLVDGQ
jgi:hypothetical protein